MAITKNDIKIFQAQDNTDNDSGGGSRTSVEIEDGAVNNLFPDISRINTVAGDVGLRKIFPTVFTENNDVYYGAHAIIRKNPTDPKVSSLLFHTDDPTDRRISAQDMIESYVTLSYKEEFYLYGNHVAGARVVTFLQRTESLPPNVGEVYLINESESKEQYIRVISTDEAEVTLSYSNGGAVVDYKRRRIICEIDQPLEHNFIGSEFHPSGQISGTATTYATQVSDASKFYGVKTLAVEGNVDDTSIKVDSIYEQLVPAAKSQSFLVNQDALQQGLGLIPTGNRINRVVSVDNYGVPFYIGDPVVPNSLTKLYRDYYQDDGLGNVRDINTNEIVATIDYKTGFVTPTTLQVSGGLTMSYEIANVFDSAIQFTSGIKITSGNQGNSYIFNLSPVPSVGDLYIDYRTQGKWYRLSSNTDNTIGNDPTIGSGNITFNGNGTASVTVTTGSLPDIDSTIVISWGSSERLSDRLDLANTLSEFSMVIDLNEKNIDPLSFSMDAYSDSHSSIRTITSDVNGVLSDTAGSDSIKGELDFIEGKLFIKDHNHELRFDDPDSGRNVDITFDYAGEAVGEVGEIKNIVASRTATGLQVPFNTEDTTAGTLTFNIGETPQLDTVRLSLKLFLGNYNPYSGRTVVLTSDAAGALRLSGRNKNDNTIWGTVAANGDVSLTFPSAQKPTYNYANVGIGKPRAFDSPLSVAYSLYYTDYNNLDEISVTYRVGDPAAYAFTANISQPIEDLAKYVISGVENIKGEISLTLLENNTSNFYRLFSKDGLMYHNVNSSGVGIQVGEIDYLTGSIELEYFGRPEDFFLEYTKIFSDELGDDLPVPIMTFRTASTNLTNSSLIISYETANGAYTGQTIDANGQFLPPATDIDVANSYVDTETGMVEIQFTSPVIPSSIKYDAVAETSLPLDPELLGLNPVRLPSDGRVPVFKSAYIIVIFHEEDTPVTGGTPVADQVENLSRSGQSYIEVKDANGLRLNPDQYVADRAAGTVTFGNPLLLEDKYGTPLTAPYTITDRIEDMVMANSVEINGLIKLVSPLTHAFPADDTKVASALVWDDIGSRVYNLFHQEIWNSGSPVWSDDLIGDTTTSKYDTVNYPLLIDNKSSTSGRWAIIFTNSTTVKVAHETLGIVDENISISVDDVAPINPATGAPYFVMDKDGFGTGWVTNNVIRFNTDSGDANAWVIRTIQTGALSELTDSIEIEVRGDAN